MTKRGGALSLASCALVALLALLVAAGCRQVASIDDGPRPPELACGAASRTPDCTSCMTASCCPESASCGADSNCASFAACDEACAPGDLACSSACRTRFPQANANAAARSSCRASRCGSACEVQCGGYVYADAACGACGTQHCCELAAACAASTECALLTDCERGCAMGAPTYASCLHDCELAHPEGVATERAFGSCLSTACPATCIQPQWSCLQHPAAPTKPTGNPIQITYRFVDYATGAPLVGLSVQACSTTAPSCLQPIVPPTQTDAAGTAVLTFEGSFDGYAEIRGPLIPTVSLFLPIVTNDMALTDVPIPSTEALPTFIGTRAPPRADASALFVSVFDCNGSAASGVRLSVAPSAESSGPQYFVGKLLSETATATDGSGRYAGGVFENVKAGTALTVNATVAVSSLSYPPALVLARAGTNTITYAFLYASPPR